MPVSRSKRRQKTARTTAAAVQLLDGKSVTAIAHGAGVTRRTIQRDLQDPNARALLAGVILRLKDRFESLFEQSLDVVANGLKACKLAHILDPDDNVDEWIELPDVPDHRVRLDAVDRLVKLAQVAQASQPESSGNQELEWEQFELMFLERHPEPPRKTLRSTRPPRKAAGSAHGQGKPARSAKTSKR